MICDAIKTELFKYTDDMLEKGNGYDQESSGIFAERVHYFMYTNYYSKLLGRENIWCTQKNIIKFYRGRG